MRILHIVAASSGFYCENCLRDQFLARKLGELGHDIVLMPLYLPLPSGEDIQVEKTPVFFDAINLYLKEKFGWYRRLPSWMQKPLSSPLLLNIISGNPRLMRASGLEDMTISVLQGEDGRQAQELERMIEWLATQKRPEIIHISNALLIGVVNRLKEEFKCPVVCSLQDEDQWVDSMDESGRRRIWEIISGKARGVDAFVSVSDYYAGIMKERLKIPDARMLTCHVGIDAGRYKAAKPDPERPLIGYLSRLSEPCGAGVLINAFIELKRKDKFKNLRLSLAGGFTGDDLKFIGGLKSLLSQNGLSDDCEFVQGLDESSRLAFLQKLTLLCVPSLKPEAFGLFQLEAMASAVPVVEPDMGGYREVVGLTRAGILYSPNTPQNLASKIESLLGNPAMLKEFGENGRKETEGRFSVARMAERTLEIYQKILSGACV